MSPVYRRWKKRAMLLARKHLSPDTKRKLRRLQYAALRGRASAVGRSKLPSAKAAFGVKKYDEAESKVAKILKANPHDLAALELASRIAVRTGDFSTAGVQAMNRAVRSKDPGHWSYARKIVGRTRETDERWQPHLATPQESTAEESTAVGGRVLYLAKESRPFLHNGYCTRSHETLQALRLRGRDVVGVTMPGFPGEDISLESLVEDVRYRHLLPNAGGALRALALDEYVELSTRMLAGVVAAERPSVLHVTSGHRGFESALAGNAVARWAGIPWCYEVRSFFETTWTDDPRYAEHGEYYERRFATETRMMRAADLIVTLSGPMRDEIVETHGIPQEKVRVIPNAVDVTRFAPQSRDEALRRKLGLTDTSTLGYVSNLSHPREGQEVLIEAVALMRRAGRKVTGLLVGDGNRREELERLASKLGVSKQVVFAGSVPFDQVAAYYAQIDLFVVPRIDDRAARMVSPMKPFEAMAMKIPLLVADLPALAEIVGSTRGRTFTAGDPRDLAAAAGRLLDAPGDAESLADTAAEWVASERTWTSVAAAFDGLYNELTELVPERAAGPDPESGAPGYLDSLVLAEGATTC